MNARKILSIAQISEYIVTNEAIFYVFISHDAGEAGHVHKPYSKAAFVSPRGLHALCQPLPYKTSRPFAAHIQSHTACFVFIQVFTCN